MKKLAAAFLVAMTVVLAAGCAHRTPEEKAQIRGERACAKALNRIAGPTEMGDGTYVMASYSRTLNAE